MQYMIILFLLFLIQFSIASSCLAVSSDQQKQLAEEGWTHVSDDLKSHVQETFVCCGFNSTDAANTNNHPSCEAITVDLCVMPYASTPKSILMFVYVLQNVCCPTGSPPDCACQPCLPKLEDTISYAFKLCGGIGMFFSFTEVSYKSLAA